MRFLPAARRREALPESPAIMAAAIPDCMLLPARLHTTSKPAAAMASAMRPFVVVLPFVPVTTTDPSRSPDKAPMI